MKTNYKLIFTSLILFIVSVLNYAQDEIKKSSSVVRPLITLDSVSDIKINKIIFYKNPICLEDYSPIDSSYIPLWYKTFCANSNIEYFSDYANEAIHYFDPESGVTKNDLTNVFQAIKSQGGSKSYFSKNFPEHKYLNIYNEIWFTNKKSDEKFLVINGFYNRINQEKIDSLFKFWDNDEIKEQIDTVKTWTFFTFKIINDTIKWIPQEKFDEVYLQNKKTINPYATSFKKMVYRSNNYILSEVIDRKRIFKTMEKTSNEFKIIKISDKSD